MSQEEGRVARLERQMEAVLRRLEGLDAEPPVAEPDETPAAEGDIQGSLAYTGSIQRGEHRFVFRHRERIADALDVDAESVARVFAALGNSFRVVLLRALLTGPRTSQELQAVLDVGPVGQLYHHLKELMAADLVVQRKRSVYAIRDDKLMPLYLVFAAGPRLATEPAPAQEAE